MNECYPQRTSKPKLTRTEPNRRRQQRREHRNQLFLLEECTPTQNRTESTRTLETMRGVSGRQWCALGFKQVKFMTFLRPF